MNNNPKLGFIGQGWVGRHCADSFEARGFSVVRYALEAPFVENKKEIPHCDIVFIAVPTPATPEGFDDRHVKDAVALVGEGKIAVIKSTIPPGTTRMLAGMYPGKFIIHIPEFLREAYARYDVDKPDRLIIGIPEQLPDYRAYADLLVQIHPTAKYTEVVSSEEAEFLKYAHNTLGYATIVFTNLLYELAQKHGVEWTMIKEFILNNPWYPSKYLDPVHKSGRGAGGSCFIKDFATFREVYEKDNPNDREGIALLRAFEAKNNTLLRESGKDLSVLRGVYGGAEE